MNVVWFKKDLRVTDHQALFAAARAGNVLPLYCYEPELIQAEDYDPAHLHFLNDSLRSLRHRLREKGSDLVLRKGCAADVLRSLHASNPISAVFAHEETGNDLSYQRDRKVRAWAKDQGIPVHEFPSNGVVRRLKTRDDWSKIWRRRMTQPLLPSPEGLSPVPLSPGEILEAHSLNLAPTCKELQKGGEEQALQTLRNFLSARGQNYSKGISSPRTSVDSCSRLSPYLTFGNLSMRQVFQLTKRRTEQNPDPVWRASLRAFQSRLHWHCHFIQKLEDEPQLEFQNMCRAYDGLRENDFNEEFFSAWCQGQTGYPLVDACMRHLHRTGWINFRMRAMLVSFASYHLWLHWKRPALFLARQFLDYEPGIHYSQIQMQSGVTGINSIRIYSPIKQVHDQDPQGEFIRQNVPELENVPAEFIAEPHTMPPLLQAGLGCIIGEHYPAPIVEHRLAYNTAKKRIFERKKKARVPSQAVFRKHGSRRKLQRR